MPHVSLKHCSYSPSHMASSTAWIGDVAGANDVHPVVECSNKGLCDRSTGECICFANYDGIACERTICPNLCSDAGVCFTLSQIAQDNSRVYSTPWDADKQVGCVCDLGRRGPDCSLSKLPTPLGTISSLAQLSVPPDQTSSKAMATSPGETAPAAAYATTRPECVTVSRATTARGVSTRQSSDEDSGNSSVQ